jgi:hypothetical protein
MTLCGDLVAGTIKAQGFAKWKMHVNRQWQQHGAGPTTALRQRLGQMFGCESFYEIICRWVRGIARAENIKPMN